MIHCPRVSPTGTESAERGGSNPPLSGGQFGVGVVLLFLRICCNEKHVHLPGGRSSCDYWNPLQFYWPGRLTDIGRCPFTAEKVGSTPPQATNFTFLI